MEGKGCLGDAKPARWRFLPGPGRAHRRGIPALAQCLWPRLDRDLLQIRTIPGGRAEAGESARSEDVYGFQARLVVVLAAVHHARHRVGASVWTEHRQAGTGAARAAWDPGFQTLIAPNRREFLHHSGLKPIIDGGRQFFHWHVCKSVHSLWPAPSDAVRKQGRSGTTATNQARSRW